MNFTYENSVEKLYIKILVEN